MIFSPTRSTWTVFAYASWSCIRGWFLLVITAEGSKKSKSATHTYARHALVSPRDVILKHQTWLRSDTQWLDSEGSSVWYFAECHATRSSILQRPGDRICWCICAEATWFKAHRLSRWGLESDWFRAIFELLDFFRFGVVWICKECSCAMRLREVLDDCSMLGPADVAVRTLVATRANWTQHPTCCSGSAVQCVQTLHVGCFCRTLVIFSHFHMWPFIGVYFAPEIRLRMIVPK